MSSTPAHFSGPTDGCPLFRGRRLPGRVEVALEGELTERFDSAPLEAYLVGDVVLDLAGITRINSVGVRGWVQLMERLVPPRVASVTWVRCAPAVVVQLNTIFNFRGAARVESILAPYVCEQCQTDELLQLDVGALVYLHGAPRPPEQVCARCRGPLVFDELPERYLSFIDRAP